MNQAEVYQQLNEIFKENLDLDEVNLTASTTADDIEGWDSLAHIGLIAAIEQQFGIRFVMKEIVGLHNVGEMVELILSKLNA